MLKYIHKIVTLLVGALSILVHIRNCLADFLLEFWD